MFVLFVDLSAAFDHVIRDWLFKSIFQRFETNQDVTLFKILKAIYAHTTTALSETPDDLFEILTGVRQGGPESPLLYNLYMDYVMRVYENACNIQGIKFLKLKYRIRATATTREERMRGYQGSHFADWSGYADDLELFFVSAEDLQKGLVLLHEIFIKFGLSINIKKTKTMIFNFELVKEKYVNMCYPESIVELDNIAVENVVTFRYLGDEIKHDEPSTGDAEMNLRISLAQAKFYEIIKNLTSHRMYLKTKL